MTDHSRAASAVARAVVGCRVGALLLVCSAVSVRAQNQARDSGARLERVADGVYAILHDDATDQWPHGNTGVVVTDQGVLVVDATYLPSRARADIALIRSITDRPVRYLVYSHWHFDHNNGAIAYREAFPDITIVSERQTRDYIALNAAWWARMSVAPGSARRAGLAALQRELVAGRDSSGRMLGEDQKRGHERAVAQRTSELRELADLTVVPPDLVFDDQLTLWLGDRRIELRDHGRANSPHDVTVYLPQDSVVFTGDILVQSPLPYVGASWPVPWIDVLRRVEALPMKTLVPGHGPVMHDFRYARQMRSLLEAATSRVSAMALEGRTLDDIQDSLRLDDIRKSVSAWTGAALDEDWKETVRILLERAWRGVRGQG
ncbi:MAG TPA: MBL fold metallo-hydrolase [Gemmatimonadales bacterium]|nr:MBL fold metallo-hydrolase [Gemmatimonadales bacterium]